MGRIRSFAYHVANDLCPRFYIYIYIYMAGSQGPPNVLRQHVVESVQNIAVMTYYKHSILDLRYGE